MKTCKSCKSEIHQEASKCPYCQSFQNWSGRWYYFLPLFLVIPVLFVCLMKITSLFRLSDFSDYKNQVTYQFISKEVLKTTDNQQTIRIIGAIDNKSKKKWRSAELVITVNDENGAFHKEIYSSGYNEAKIPAKNKSKISNFTKCDSFPESYTFDVKLVNMIEYK